MVTLLCTTTVGLLHTLIPTYVMLLQKAVQGWQVLNNELPEDPLVCLDSEQSGGEVGGREEVFDQGAHHPQNVLLLEKKQQTGNNLQESRMGKRRLEESSND